MSILSLLLLLLVAGIVGAVAQAIVGFSRVGFLGSIAIGFVGAFLGVYLSRLLNLPEWFSLRFDNQSFPVVWSIIGSVLFVAVLSLLVPRRRRLYV